MATAVGVAAAGAWEMGEWVGLKLGAKGMDLSYDDMMEDLIETSAGALLGVASPSCATHRDSGRSRADPATRSWLRSASINDRPTIRDPAAPADDGARVEPGRGSTCGSLATPRCR